MKIHIICPVRLGVPESVVAYVKKLEDEGHKVHFPPRDVDQLDSTGWNICSAHRDSLITADEVHLFYKATSQGIHFDLGMAFALSKKIRLIEVYKESDSRYPSQPGGKSYLRFIGEWERRQDENRS